ncbi:MurR/RpiR family transcriptional regulator [Bacillus enclensis]|nr:MurR/RpiR family transcriptional regulator [[Bacillus] enclensis]MBH9968249.1 MurR/RpiR family transcriptional regulator [[Bacillus] enclensis]
MITAGKSSPMVLISSHYKSMTKSEQKVADYVVNQTEEAVYLTVTDLAEKVGVGETTVLRFCRKLNYKGYQDFKLAVAQSRVGPEEKGEGEVAETDSLDVVAAKITRQNAKTLADTLELFQSAGLQRAIDLLSSAGQISFFGIGSSGLTAQDAEHRFMRMGFHVNCSTDSHVMAMKAALAGGGDVVVGISTSGSTKDVVDTMRIAKENGAKVICITNHGRSPITRYADVILLAASKESPLQGGAFSSKIAQLHLLDILTKAIEMQRREPTYGSIKKTAEAVLDKMY